MRLVAVTKNDFVPANTQLVWHYKPLPADGSDIVRDDIRECIPTQPSQKQQDTEESGEKVKTIQFGQ